MAVIVAEIYAFSEAVKHAQFLVWRMEDIGHKLPRPIEIYEDNSASISFQKSTKTNTKLRGIYNFRWEWIIVVCWWCACGVLVGAGLL